MKKIVSYISLATLICLMLVFLCGCQSTSKVSSSSTSVQPQVKVDSSRKYGLNEEVTIKTSSSEYTLKITGIKETYERNEFSEKNPAQVFIIDYEYVNVKGSSLYISDMDFKIIDADSEIGDTYPVDYTYPKSVTEGVKCKASMALCVYNRSSNITLQYFDNFFNSTPDVVFSLDI